MSRVFLVTTLAGPLLLSASACSQKAACESISGSCLSLRVEGSGSFNALEMTLHLPDTTRTGDIPGDVTIPTTLRVVPPEGVDSDIVNRLSLIGKVNGLDAASGETPLNWPRGEHIEATVTLNGGGNGDGGPTDDLPPIDMGPPDLTPPSPVTKWTANTVPVITAGKELFDIWVGPANRGYAVGEEGILYRQTAVNTWTDDSFNKTIGNFRGVFGSGNNYWLVAQNMNEGAYKTMTPTGGGWMMARSGLSGSLYGITACGTTNDMWAVDGSTGNVWHYVGNAWQTELVMAGQQLHAIACAGSTVFAVGGSMTNGFAAVRQGGTWTIKSTVNGLGMGTAPSNATGRLLLGVWAIDANNAVAVGTGGSLVRFRNNAWGSTPISIAGANKNMRDVWAGSTFAYAVGEGGVVVRVNANDTTVTYTQAMLTIPATQDVTSVFGVNESDVYVCGGFNGAQTNAFILHGTAN